MGWGWFLAAVLQLISRPGVNGLGPPYDACLHSGLKCVLWDDPDSGYTKFRSGDWLFTRDDGARGRMARQIVPGKILPLGTKSIEELRNNLKYQPHHHQISSHIGMTTILKHNGEAWRYIPEWEEGTVITYVELMRSPKYDVETGMIGKNFLSVPLMLNLINQPLEGLTFIRRRVEALDPVQLEKMQILSDCNHYLMPSFTRFIDPGTPYNYYDQSIAYNERYKSPWRKQLREQSQLQALRMFCASTMMMYAMEWSPKEMQRMGGESMRLRFVAPVDFEELPFQGYGKGKECFFPSSECYYRKHPDFFMIQTPRLFYKKYKEQLYEQNRLIQEKPVPDLPWFEKKCKEGVDKLTWFKEVYPEWVKRAKESNWKATYERHYRSTTTQPMQPNEALDAYVSRIMSKR